MAQRYRKVDPRFWHDERVQKLTPDGILMALYAFTCPDCNRIGLYRFSIAKAGEDTKVKSPETVWHTVCQGLGWGFDKVSKTLLLPSWWRYNHPDNPKAFMGALSDLHDVPSSPLISKFFANKKHLKTPYTDMLDEYSMRYGMAYQEQEQEQEQEQDIVLDLSHSVASDSDSVIESRDKLDLDRSSSKAKKPASKQPAKNKITPDYENKKWVGITQVDFDLWVKAYPAVDVKKALFGALAWAKDNPAKCKKDWRRFIGNWLARRQEKGGDIASNGSYGRNGMRQTSLIESAKSNQGSERDYGAEWQEYANTAFAAEEPKAGIEIQETAHDATNEE
jgi:hypothetical protein